MDNSLSSDLYENNDGGSNSHGFAMDSNSSSTRFTMGGNSGGSSSSIPKINFNSIDILMMNFNDFSQQVKDATDALEGLEKSSVDFSAMQQMGNKINDYVKGIIQSAEDLESSRKRLEAAGIIESEKTQSKSLETATNTSYSVIDIDTIKTALAGMNIAQEDINPLADSLARMFESYGLPSIDTKFVESFAASKESFGITGENDTKSYVGMFSKYDATNGDIKKENLLSYVNLASRKIADIYSPKDTDKKSLAENTLIMSSYLGKQSIELGVKFDAALEGTIEGLKSISNIDILTGKTGNQDFTETAEKLGLIADGKSTLKDESGNIKNLVEIEGILQNAYKVNSTEFERVITEALGDNTGGVKILTNIAAAKDSGTDSFAATKERADAVNQKYGNASDEEIIYKRVDIINDSAAAQLDAFGKNLSFLKDMMGQSFMEPIKKSFAAFNNVLSGTISYLENHPKALSFVSELAKGAGTLALLAGSLFTVSAGAKLTSKAFGSFMGYFNPAVLAGAADELGRLRVGENFFADIKNIPKNIGKVLTFPFKMFKQGFASAFLSALPLVAIVALIAGVALVVYKNWDKLSPLFGQLQDSLNRLVEAAAPLINKMIESIKPAAEAIWNIFEKIVMFLIENVLPIIIDIIDFIAALFEGNMDLVEELGKKIIRGLMNLIIDIGAGIANMFASIIGGLVEKIPLLKDIPFLKTENMKKDIETRKQVGHVLVSKLIKVDETKIEASRVETPKVETPKVETPKSLISANTTLSEGSMQSLQNDIDNAKPLSTNIKPVADLKSTDSSVQKYLQGKTYNTNIAPTVNDSQAQATLKNFSIDGVINLSETTYENLLSQIPGVENGLFQLPYMLKFHEGDVSKMFENIPNVVDGVYNVTSRCNFLQVQYDEMFINIPQYKAGVLHINAQLEFLKIEEDTLKASLAVNKNGVFELDTMCNFIPVSIDDMFAKIDAVKNGVLTINSKPEFQKMNVVDLLNFIVGLDNGKFVLDSKTDFEESDAETVKNQILNNKPALDIPCRLLFGQKEDESNIFINCKEWDPSLNALVVSTKFKFDTEEFDNKVEEMKNTKQIVLDCVFKYDANDINIVINGLKGWDAAAQVLNLSTKFEVNSDDLKNSIDKIEETETIHVKSILDVDEVNPNLFFNSALWNPIDNSLHVPAKIYRENGDIINLITGMQDDLSGQILSATCTFSFSSATLNDAFATLSNWNTETQTMSITTSFQMTYEDIDDNINALQTKITTPLKLACVLDDQGAVNFLIRKIQGALSLSEENIYVTAQVTVDEQSMDNSIKFIQTAETKTVTLSPEINSVEVTKEINKVKEDLQESGQNGLIAFMEGLFNDPQLEGLGIGIKNNINLKITENLIRNDEMKTIGTELTQNLSDGIIDTTQLETVKTNITSNLNEAVMGAIVKRDDMYTRGKELAEGLANGIIENQSFIVEAVLGVSRIISSNLNVNSSTAEGPLRGTTTWGINLLGGFAKGMNSNMGAVQESIAEGTTIVSDNAGVHSPTKKGPLRTNHLWGGNLVKAFAVGISKNVGLVKNAITGVSTIVDTGMNKNLTVENNKSFTESLRNGITSIKNYAFGGNTDSLHEYGGLNTNINPIQQETSNTNIQMYIYQNENESQDQLATRIADIVEKRTKAKKNRFSTSIPATMTNSRFGFRGGY